MVTVIDYSYEIKVNHKYGNLTLFFSDGTDEELKELTLQVLSAMVNLLDKKTLKWDANQKWVRTENAKATEA